MIWLAVALAQTTTHGEWRVVEMLPSPVVVDSDGLTPQWGPALDHRLRFGLDATDGEKVRLGFEADVLRGQFAGATWGLSELDERHRDRRGVTAEGSAAIRRLVGGLRLSVADIEVGIVSSHWGMGLVANDGAHPSWFGREDFGDRTARARVATAPLGKEVPLFLIVAGDRVISDELARASQGDDAYQGIVSLLWRQDGGEGGIYGVRRVQQSAGRSTSVWVVDGTGKIVRDVAEGVELKVEAEVAMILGQTTLQRTAQSPDGVAVRQGGAVAAAELWGERAAGLFKVAYASGDKSADDDTLSNFRFDRDHNVGMVLFDEVQGAVELAAIDAAKDPDRGAVPADGVDNLATEGAFQSAFALQPVVVFAPMSAIEVRLGGVFAWSTAPIAQPVETALNGGVPTNALGVASDGRYLGTELDWAIGTRVPTEWRFKPQLQLQGGHAFVSEAWLGGQRVDLMMLSGKLRW